MKKENFLIKLTNVNKKLIKIKISQCYEQNLTMMVLIENKAIFGIILYHLNEYLRLGTIIHFLAKRKFFY